MSDSCVPDFIDPNCSKEEAAWARDPLVEADGTVAIGAAVNVLVKRTHLLRDWMIEMREVLTGGDVPETQGEYSETGRTPGVVQVVEGLVQRLDAIEDRLERHADALAPLVAKGFASQDDVRRVDNRCRDVIAVAEQSSSRESAKRRELAARVDEFIERHLPRIDQALDWALRYRDEVRERESRPGRLQALAYVVTGRWGR